MAFMKSKNENSWIPHRRASGKPEGRGIREEYYYKWDDDSHGKPTKFSILFGINNKKYRYELCRNKGFCY